jgi:ERCC4-type nuclease
VRIEHLAVGDYWIDRGIVVERKSYADFALSLADGRLFPQAARLARCPHRPVVLLEGPRPLRMPQMRAPRHRDQSFRRIVITCSTPS